MKKDKVKIGISIGDIAGVGMEVIIKACMDSRILNKITPIVYGDYNLAKFYRKGINIHDFSFNPIVSADKSNPKRVNIVNIEVDKVNLSFGKSTKETGALALKSLDMATKDLAANKIEALVTAPIDKNTIQSKGFDFPGHTEYLANMSNVDDALMLMIEDDLRVGVVTGHIPIKEVANAISDSLIIKKLELLNRSLINDFEIVKPKIAVLALNPHASDHGLIGDEEEKVIIPAVKEANEMGILTFGPYSADAFFGQENYKNFDAILAMYHDQGLIPFKTLAAKGGVNYTAGLPIVRTSPAHGTAFDIAGKGIANESSFREALFAAYDIFQTRKKLKEWTADPLQKTDPKTVGKV